MLILLYPVSELEITNALASMQKRTKMRSQIRSLFCFCKVEDAFRESGVKRTKP